MGQIAVEIRKMLGSLVSVIPGDILNSYSKEISGQKTALSRCSNVENLIILSRNTQQDIKVYVNQGRSHMLLISPTPEQVDIVLKKCGSKLQKLTLQFALKELDVSGIRGLRELHVSNCKTLAKITGLELLTGLHVIDLSSTALTGILDLTSLRELTEICIRDTGISRIQLSDTLPGMTKFDAADSSIADESFLEMFPNLRILNLERTEISKLECGVSFQMLEELSLSGTSIESLDDFLLPTCLKYLHLDGTRITTIPDGVQSLHQLEHLGLTRLNLDIIPSWFPDYDLLEIPGAVELFGTRVAGEPINLLGLSVDNCRQTLRMYASQNQSEYKVILLGDAESGKTLTLYRLLHDDEKAFEESANNDDDPNTYVPAGFDHNSTPGINIEDKIFDLSKYGLGTEEIRVHFWDFGGQEILHSAHSMFLTDKTLYVILLNTRNDTQDERARYWLRFLQGVTAKRCPVILVQNKIDQNPHASVDENTLRAKYRNICDIRRVSALKYNRRRFSEELTKSILSKLVHTDGLKMSFPSRYQSVRDYLESTSEPCIDKDVLLNRCIDIDDAHDNCCGIIDAVRDDCCGDIIAARKAVEEKYKPLLEKIKRLGIGYYCGDKTDACSFLILRPQWLTNAIYTILFNMHSKVKNGLIRLQTILDLLNPPDRLRKYVKQVDKEQKYAPQSIPYVVDAMHAMNLAFPLHDENRNIFIPMLCERNTPDFLKEYTENPQALNFRFCYDVFPKVILFRLMYKLYEDSKSQDIWLTGARFGWDDYGCSVVLQLEDNTLSLCMKSDGLNSRERDRLWMLIEEINSINKDFKSVNVKQQIGFRCPSKIEYYDYVALKGSLKLGNQLVFSSAKDGLVYIDDIIKFTDDTDDRMQMRLLEHILHVCGQMQNNHHYYQCGEDIRNTYLRDSLDNLGYTALDQTLQGLGSGEQAAGRPDLKINSELDKTLTLLEALILKSNDDGAIKYWYGHLNRLLVQYNQTGHPYLFLLNYIPDDGEKFGNICDTFCRCIQNQIPTTYKLTNYNPDKVYSDEANHRRVVQCTYLSNGKPTIVYHIFVRFWQKPERITGDSGTDQNSAK